MNPIFVIPRPIAAIATLALMQFPTVASACTVCMGKPTDSPMAEAMNGAIYFMLLCVGAMFVFLAAVGIAIVRRGHEPLPPHAQLSSSSTLTTSNDSI